MSAWARRNSSSSLDHPRFAAVYPEAAEQMIAARALREGFEASVEAQALGRRTRTRSIVD